METEYEMDGAAATDRRSLFAALGAALNGPGGYYGRNLDALVDCLRGGFGPQPPFTLHWRDFAVADTAPALRAGYAREVVEVLREAGVTVRLS
ncbi:ribonuclease inhibitor [Streptomyces tateyamensis]|uniref:Ribonuclease inhibitor n=1 Tax=Streptomyces tateyamensis TaxID=565073 RepID=A0A2V4NIZ8_9ACTN|nr:barstar family protein [Streptomyces tateyamensis]PYC68211.1 ribonuclease inhibitor [Streptomyces tateyamensis]